MSPMHARRGGSAAFQKPSMISSSTVRVGGMMRVGGVWVRMWVCVVVHRQRQRTAQSLNRSTGDSTSHRSRLPPQGWLLCAASCQLPAGSCWEAGQASSTTGYPTRGAEVKSRWRDGEASTTEGWGVESSRATATALTSILVGPRAPVKTAIFVRPANSLPGLDAA